MCRTFRRLVRLVGAGRDTDRRNGGRAAGGLALSTRSYARDSRERPSPSPRGREMFIPRPCGKRRLLYSDRGFQRIAPAEAFTASFRSRRAPSWGSARGFLARPRVRASNWDLSELFPEARGDRLDARVFAVPGSELPLFGRRSTDLRTEGRVSFAVGTARRGTSYPPDHGANFLDRRHVLLERIVTVEPRRSDTSPSGSGFSERSGQCRGADGDLLLAGQETRSSRMLSGPCSA